MQTMTDELRAQLERMIAATPRDIILALVYHAVYDETPHDEQPTFFADNDDFRIHVIDA